MRSSANVSPGEVLSCIARNASSSAGYGATIRFRQKFEGDGTHLEEIDLSVFDLPLTLLDTSLP